MTDGVTNGVTWRIYYPQNFSGDPPVLIMLMGIGGGFNSYMGPLFASNGFCAIEPYMPVYPSYENGSLNFAEFFDTALVREPIIADFVFSQSFPLTVDKSKVALIGASAGGGCVLMFNDSRVNATVAMIPYYLAGYPIINQTPIILTCGENDTTAPYATMGLTFYNSLDDPKMIINEKNSGHSIYTGERYYIAWLNYYLYGNSTAYSFIQNVGSDTTIANYFEHIT